MKFFCVFLIFSASVFADEENRWQVTDYIWNLGIASTCDVGPDKNPFKYFQGSEHIPSFIQVKNIGKNTRGDVIWMRPCFVSQFCRDVLPNLSEPVILVISDGDASFPSQSIGDVNQLIRDRKIIHIFAQNCDYRGPSDKISHLPIGIDFHSIAFKGWRVWDESGTPREQEAVLKDVLSVLQPTHLRKVRAFVDFHLQDSMRHGNFQRYLEFGEDRTTIFNRLLGAGLIDYAKSPMKRSDLWKIKGQYAFSISPHGNGLDCHRTWEDLVLGCIVIVKTSPLDPLYEGLPVVIVKDWGEVTEESMERWLEQYKDAFTNPLYREKLTNAYWIEKIKSYKTLN